LRNRAFDDQTIIPPSLQLFTNTIDSFKIKTCQTTNSIVMSCQEILRGDFQAVINELLLEYF